MAVSNYQVLFAIFFISFVKGTVIPFSFVYKCAFERSEEGITLRGVGSSTMHSTLISDQEDPVITIESFAGTPSQINITFATDDGNFTDIFAFEGAINFGARPFSPHVIHFSEGEGITLQLDISDNLETLFSGTSPISGGEGFFRDAVGVMSFTASASLGPQSKQGTMFLYVTGQIYSEL